MSDFKWHHFEGQLILMCVRWYCRYGISYRDLQEMLEERGFKVCHTTLYRWVQKYAPILEKRLRWYKNRFQWNDKLHLDETYLKIKGRWCYLYRAINQRGETVDFYLSTKRDTQAAKTFLKKVFKPCKLPSDYPRVVIRLCCKDFVALNFSTNHRLVFL